MSNFFPKLIDFTLQPQLLVVKPGNKQRQLFGFFLKKAKFILKTGVFKTWLKRSFDSRF